ncbi:MAG: glycosyltransferase [Candidatus Bathyarchaeota archaeon]|nr:MAG: glycosyltransferase [Candidatus Bathyarchaeota archaeon]
MRVLVFTNPNNSSILEALSSLASVKQVNWYYKPIPDATSYVFLKIIYRSIESIYWVLQVFREIHRFGADVVVSQYAYFDSLIGAIAALLSKKPFVVRAIGSDLRIAAKWRLGSVIAKLIFKTATGAICVSRDLEAIAQRFGAKNTVVVPSSLDLTGFQELNLRRKNNEIITVAHLASIKGMPYLLQAMTFLKDGRLIIIGDGPERTRLESMSASLGVNGRVFFKGWIAHDREFWGHLQQATVFVLPSLSEGRPRAVIEAMACGLPVVATDVGGIPEMVSDGVNGLLVPPRDAKALAEAIEYIVDDVDFQRRASTENLKMAAEYSPSIIGRRIYDYLEKILHGAG